MHIYIYIYIFMDLRQNIYSYCCVASCIPKNRLESHARINEHMAINEDSGNINKFRGKNDFKPGNTI